MQETEKQLKLLSAELISFFGDLPAFFRKVVDKNDEMFQFIPDKYKTPEMCLEVVKKSGKMFKYVPENYKTGKVYLKLLESNYRVFKYYPENLMNIEQWRFVMKR